MTMKRVISTIFLAAGVMLAQTTINGSRSILGDFDASAAKTTKPVKTGTSDPANCSVGELFYRTDTATLKYCSAANTWTAVSVSYTLPIASGSTLGGVKVGTGLSIDGGGVLSTSGGGGGSTFDAHDTSTLWLREDFINGGTSTSSANAGELGWFLTLLASATVNQNNTTVDASHPGVLLSLAHASNANSGVLAQILNSVHYNAINNNDWSWTVILKLASTSNSRTWVGIGGQAAITPVRFVGFRYDTASGYDDDLKNGTGSWVFQMCNAATTCADGSGTQIMLGVAPTTDWIKLQMVKVGTLYTIKVNGTTVATVCPSGCTATATLQDTASYIGNLGLGFESGGSFTTFVDFFAATMTGLVR
jgi:hypothetical protein